MSIDSETRYLSMRKNLDERLVVRLFTAYRNYHWDRWEVFREDIPIRDREDFRLFLSWLFRPEDLLRRTSSSSEHNPDVVEASSVAGLGVEPADASDVSEGEGQYLLDKPYYYDKPRDTYVVIGKGEGKVSIHPKMELNPDTLALHWQ